MQPGLGRIVPQRGQLLDQQVGCLACEYSREQFSLARPVEIHRALADARPARDFVHGDPAITEADEQWRSGSTRVENNVSAGQLRMTERGSMISCQSCDQRKS